MERTLFDIHMHLIPGVDDGAADLEMAAVMLHRAYEQGVRGIVATPHSSAFFDDPEAVRQNWQKLRTHAGRFYRDMKLYLGCEVYCSRDSMEMVLKALETGQLPSMNGTKFILTEFSQWTEPENALYCAEKLLEAGWKPIIAHVERYRRLRGEPTRQLKKMGCLLQINVYSIYDEMDPEMKAWARELVAEGLVDYLGSDAHRTYHRPPSVRMGVEYLFEHYDQDYIRRIAWENPMALVKEE